MEQGLAHQMVYGSGSNQAVKHYYAGASGTKSYKNKANKRKKPCKKQ